MRGSTRFALQAREGEERVVRKFLLWPRGFEAKEWRWLEWADLVEKVTKIDVGGSMQWGCYAWKWVEIGFAPMTVGRYDIANGGAA